LRRPMRRRVIAVKFNRRPPPTRNKGTSMSNDDTKKPDIAELVESLRRLAEYLDKLALGEAHESKKPSGLLKSIARVKLIYQADTSQARSELKALAAEERAYAAERLRSIEEGNAKIAEQAANWERVVAKQQLAHAGLSLAAKGLLAYANHVGSVVFVDGKPVTVADDEMLTIVDGKIAVVKR
jgi:hypothetical protein